MLYDDNNMNDQPITSNTSETKTVKNNSKKGLIGVVILLLVALGGIGSSIYMWRQNAGQQTSLNNKDMQIRNLNSQITSLKSSTMSTPATSANIIAIRELGISITVPDSIKDLTYSYVPIANENGKFEAVDFSTKTLSDQYASTDRNSDQCTSFGIAPPLGAFEKWSGVYANNPVTSHLHLVKQLDGFYIMYDTPQAACMTNAQPGPNPISVQLTAFQNSFATIKKL